MTFASKQSVEPSITKPTTLPGNHNHAFPKSPVIGTGRAVSDCHAAKADGFTRPPFTHLMMIHQMRDSVPLRSPSVTINGMVRLVLLQHTEVAKPKEVSMVERNKPRLAAVYGIDIGKNIFHVVGLGDDGSPVQKVKFRRDTLLEFFERAAS